MNPNRRLYYTGTPHVDTAYQNYWKTSKKSLKYPENKPKKWYERQTSNMHCGGLLIRNNDSKR